ncbi:hypothetical protein HJG53_14015 [Sphingomonas sp. ID1715]|uniref:hypothetical protein n=1 Tax=Sphingomonas sp. ID1715 TaxID=1656898 RepID=UPI001488627F|nr:hypothetical protein [Sphingomonas sp. ID1715]NNM78018.1 hypothetical protein [Sphingomonas sp. ID1715]
MSKAAARFRQLLADSCFVALMLTLWSGATLLVSLGTILAIALAASGGDGEVLFSHLENLSVHYLSADAAARSVFERDAAGLFAGIVTLVVLVRVPRLIARVRAGLSRGTSPG